MRANKIGKTDPKPSRLDDLAIERLAGKAVPLATLVSDLSRELGYTTDKVTEGLMGLQSRKLIVISEKTPYASFASYAFSPISLWFWWAVGATLLSVAFVSATSGPVIYLRYAFGGLLVLFLPVEHNERRLAFPVNINCKKFGRLYSQFAVSIFFNQMQ